jgi:MraZ protein
MFLGEYQTKFSGLRRLVLPRKLRLELKGKTEIILSRGFDECIWGFSKEGFEKEAEKQLSIPTVERGGRDLRRYFFSGAEETFLDLQGRFVISENLLNYAGCKGEVFLIGAGDHFEIWDLKKWNNLRLKIIQKGKNG